MNPKANKIAKIALVIFIIFVIFWVARAGYFGYRGYKWRQQTKAFEDALTKPLREDTYGGKTPEETWAMFLDALKKGDAELASKYFIVDKQEAWRITIQDTKAAKKLDLVIDNLSRGLIRDDNNIVKTDAYYYYQYINAKTRQKKNSSVVFTFNNYTNIWKISVL